MLLPAAGTGCRVALDPAGRASSTARLDGLARRTTSGSTSATPSPLRRGSPLHLTSSSPALRSRWSGSRIAARATPIETNVIGHARVLEAVAADDSVRPHHVVTTDKVTATRARSPATRESDPLGGDDPYSASKAMADLLAQSWVRSFPGVPTAIARAGNVIGGGDVSQDRLLPDLSRVPSAAGQAPPLRYPDAVRPWQHVLDCLNGYLTLVDALLAATAGASGTSAPAGQLRRGRRGRHVGGRVVGRRRALGSRRRDHPHEAALLALDASKAERELGWRNPLGFREAVAMDHRVGARGARGRRPGWGVPGADHRIRAPRVSEFDLPAQNRPAGPADATL